MWEPESDFSRGGGGGNSPASNKHDLKTDGFERRENSWYVASDIPSDLLVKVGACSFHLHKYPLLSRSGRLNRIIYDLAPRDHSDLSSVDLGDIPGGEDAFELAAKFCYGVAVDLTASNIAGLRCAAEYLEMTEDLEEGNLIFKTEAFLSYVVLSSWRDSIVVLKNSESLSPWAENLQIVRRCSESIAWKACANPRGVRWAYTGRPTAAKTSSPKWNAAAAVAASESRENSPSRGGQAVAPADWWFEDVSVLRIDHFVRVVTAIKVKGMRFELIGAAIMHYAAKWLPGLSREAPLGGETESLSLIVVAGGPSRESMTSSQIREQRMIIESLISIIPPQKDCVSCGFLLRLLRLANMLNVAPALVTELEKRVGMQFEQATLQDLLIPSYNKSETMYDVDLVQRLLEHFLVQEQTEAACPTPDYGDVVGARPPAAAANAKTRVARLVDSYLTEVARDRNLSLTKFMVLAEALPESARTCDDGLYRAVDSYLKAHPTLSEHERKRLCRVMDCQKLSIDACMHAAQNERLPLRVVVQVLFSEQLKITNAIANSSAGDPHLYYHHQPTRKQLIDATPQSFQEGWAAAKKDINTLKFELESMKAKYLELQNDMDNLQRQFDKMTTVETAGSSSVKAGGGGKQSSSAWSSGWRKLSRLTKMTAADGTEVGGGRMVGPGSAAEQGRKGPRRWRNSIS